MGGKRGNSKFLSYIISVLILSLAFPPALLAESETCKLTLRKLIQVIPSAKYWETPTISSSLIGGANIVVSEAVSVGMLAHDLPMALSVPLIALDYSLNAILVIPGKFWTNHNIQLMKTHKSLPYIRQAMIGLICSTAFKIVGNYQHLGDISISHAAAEIIVATILNTVWRTPTNSAVDNWVGQADNPISDPILRDNLRAVYGLPFAMLGAPFYIFSLMPDQNVLASLPLLEVNQWHVAMVGMGIVGSLFWKYPKLFNPTAKPIAQSISWTKNLFKKKKIPSQNSETEKENK
jgi:hypothetical protein